MNEPLASLRPRPRDDAAAMAVVTQANLVQLQVAAGKRFGAAPPTLASPGAVTKFRSALIDWRDVKNYSQAELTLRIHEIWGQHCLFCWAFHGRDPHRPPPFAALPAEELTTEARRARRRNDFGEEGELRSPCEIGAKLIEVERGLWRLRHEDRLRHQPDIREHPDFRREYETALKIPMLVFGQDVRACGDAELLACTCEYAGMLAAIRWLADDRWMWGQPGIMELDATPTLLA